MKLTSTLALALVSAFVLAFPASPPVHAEVPLRHGLALELDMDAGTIAATDSLILPGDRDLVDFVLSSSLTIVDSDPPVEEIPLGDAQGFFGLNGSSVELSDRIELKRYRLGPISEDRTVTLRYGGPMSFGLSDPREEYTRGFRDTPGAVGPDGVFLAGSGFWYPYFDQGLVEFSLEVEVPEGWHLISQGKGTSRDVSGMARWESEGAVDEIYLVGGALTEYREAAGAVDALVYLREQDDSLAGKYLTATAQYVEMYRGLIGPYPYSKFALVENFWETGYGMPSFTLLGPRVIRFPWILHSSYPHEILHNWWGNSVYVEYETGNWAEGLTAYLADHLIKEQRGQGAEYRRGTLQKYRDYVREGRDFPLSEFRSRHSAATEAVGYGKSLMTFHMLRLKIGDDAFRAGLQRFYREQKGHRASFDDLRTAFESAAGEGLEDFFEQWVTRAGAPELRVSVAGVEETESGFRVRGVVEQAQETGPFQVTVPIDVVTDEQVISAEVGLEERRTEFTIETGARPLLLAVDPAFDLFRWLDPLETASSIGQIFGSPEALAVLSTRESPELRQGYEDLLSGWQSESHAIEIVTDTEKIALPEDRSVWLLGRDNLLAEKFFADLPGLEVSEIGISLAGESVSWSEHSLVAIRRHPKNPELAVGWIVADPASALPGLGRKLPHYGKYSYLAFEGEEPENILKGQWQALDSPLRVDLRPASEHSAALPEVEREPAAALAELPPTFSRKKLMGHVEVLASPELGGRGLGSEGLEEAAQYIVQGFREAGLKPGGDDSTYRQDFVGPSGGGGAGVPLANIVGVLPGSRSEWDGQSVLVTAHYDHLGMGGDGKEMHPGADDNASGVAVLLELAAAYGAGQAPQRSLVFVAFSGEESGLLGSRHYVEHPMPFSREGIRAVVNLDTVGRLFDQDLSVLATGSAREWPHIARGCSFTTGVASRSIPGMADASDQLSFVERGIPAVQIFTQAHPDYHRPTDTIEKIDGAGLVKVSTFVKEAVTYLSEREEPLTVTAEQGEAPAEKRQSSGERRVSVGTIPDFAHSGPGVRISGVVPLSPAEKAGLMEGDVLLSLDGKKLESLRGYGEVLRTLSPGQKVEIVVVREGEEMVVPVTVVER